MEYHAFWWKSRRLSAEYGVWIKYALVYISQRPRPIDQFGIWSDMTWNFYENHRNPQICAHLVLTHCFFKSRNSFKAKSNGQGGFQKFWGIRNRYIYITINRHKKVILEWIDTIDLWNVFTWKVTFYIFWWKIKQYLTLCFAIFLNNFAEDVRNRSRF